MRGGFISLLSERMYYLKRQAFGEHLVLNRDVLETGMCGCMTDNGLIQHSGIYAEALLFPASWFCFLLNWKCESASLTHWWNM